MPERIEVTLTDKTSTRQEIPLWCEMRMRRPRDSAGPPAEASDVASPVTFEWAPVPSTERYAYEVQRFDGRTETVARGETIDTTCTTALEPSLSSMEHYRFIVSARGRSDELGGLGQVYTFRVAGGTPKSGVGRLVLVPTFDGAPLARGRDRPVTVELGREDTRTHRTIHAWLANAEIELSGIETGIYNPSFALDEKYPDPGPRSDADFLSSAPTRPMALLRNHETVRREIPVYATVEITFPPALAPGRAAFAHGRPMLQSPVRIVWKPVRGAARYRVVLQTPGNDREEPETRVSESTEALWTAELSPTPPDSPYVVIVEAHGARAQVGAALVHFGVR
jgi:hypothetical protein